MQFTTIRTLIFLVFAGLLFNQCSILMPAGSPTTYPGSRPGGATPPVVDRPTDNTSTTPGNTNNDNSTEIDKP